ncbi:MAG: hypothetical protein NCW75_00335 [Phycisphaera sp.]|nr:MAG: hypothetical protein NCW75_00335 [Phycisphaera sp.]
MTISIRTLCLLAGVAAMPAAAMAQAIEITADGLGTLPGETVTITMSASYGGTDYALAGIATSVLINEAQGTFDNLRLVAPMDGPGTTEGVLGAGSIDGILAGQLNFPTAGIYADPTNPIAFWEADFTVDDVLSGPVILDIETVTTRYDTYIDRMSSTSESRLADLEEGSLIIVIPAPAGGLALLGGLALAGGRRR